MQCPQHLAILADSTSHAAGLGAKRAVEPHSESAADEPDHLSWLIQPQAGTPAA